MAAKHVSPDIALRSFSCPHCGALADQAWLSAWVKSTQDGGPPFVMTTEQFDVMRKAAGSHVDNRTDLVAAWAREAEGIVFTHTWDSSEYIRCQLINIHVSECYSCKGLAIWRHDTLLYPPTRYEIEPNEDLLEDIRADFDEARAILDLSPRGAAALLRLCIQKLCKHLGKPGKSINDDIAALVKEGLDPRVQQALDIVRVVGNEAVHPGTMDLKDNRRVAAKLFELVNQIAYDTITRPKELKALMASLPSDKVAAIAKRDGGSTP